MKYYEFASKLFKNAGFTLDGNRAILRKAFEPYQHFVFIASRGTGKSLSEAVKILIRMIKYPGFKQLFVSPTDIQTKSFVRFNIDPLITSSPLTRYFANMQKMAQVKFKQMTNGSVTNFRHANDEQSVNRIRGLHVDALIFDEIQDMLPEVWDVLLPTLDNSKWGITEALGTFKTTSHFSYTVWSNSDQHEYGIKCEHCNYWNIPLNQYNIGPNGPICAKCGKDIYRENGQWICMNPKVHGAQNPVFGIRLSHIAAPFIGWQTILRAKEIMQWDKFVNEIIGLPVDVIDRPITEIELIRACNSNYNNLLQPTRQIMQYPIVAGIDWQGDLGKSYTVVTILAATPIGPVVYSIKKFIGKEAASDVIVQEVLSFLSKWNPYLVFADYGMGIGRNVYLKNVYGNRFAEVQYVGSAKAKVKWNKQAGRYIVDRTAAMDEVFTALKTKKLTLFSWEDLQQFKDDILCIFKDINERTQQIYYSHPTTKNDDVFHSIVMAYLAYKCLISETVGIKFDDISNDTDKEFKQKLLNKNRIRSGIISSD